MKKSIFQKRLKELRNKKGYSQEQLGLLSGMQKEIIHFCEEHDTNPSSYIIRKIANALKVSPEYLSGECDDMNYEPAEILKNISTDDLINELRRRTSLSNL